MEAPIINIAGVKTALGPLRRDLVLLYQRWMNDTEAAVTYFRGDLRPETAEDALKRYERSVNSVTFTVYETPTMRPIGVTDLSSIDAYNRTADFGVIIGEREYRSRGHGTETSRLMLDWGFHALDLHAIRLSVFSYNHAGIRAYLKAGFKEVGRWREAKRLAGEAYDLIWMDCLRSEFEGSVLTQYLPDNRGGR